MNMNAEEYELYQLQMKMFDAWIILIQEPDSYATLRYWADEYVRPYMNKLCYVKHGPRGHPDLDDEYQQQLLDEEE
jgi:hypothetical protein|tara:strand:- start:317 stop:544 length:228 start_codon:yes stop_codon:yes gene_type:complete